MFIKDIDKSKLTQIVRRQAFLENFYARCTCFPLAVIEEKNVEHTTLYRWDGDKSPTRPKGDVQHKVLSGLKALKYVFDNVQTR